VRLAQRIDDVAVGITDIAQARPRILPQAALDVATDRPEVYSLASLLRTGRRRRTCKGRG
jgi:hypothetical protein